MLRASESRPVDQTASPASTNVHRGLYRKTPPARSHCVPLKASLLLTRASTCAKAVGPFIGPSCPQPVDVRLTADDETLGVEPRRHSRHSGSLRRSGWRRPRHAIPVTSAGWHIDASLRNRTHRARSAFLLLQRRRASRVPRTAGDSTNRVPTQKNAARLRPAMAAFFRRPGGQIPIKAKAAAGEWKETCRVSNSGKPSAALRESPADDG